MIQNIKVLMLLAGAQYHNAPRSAATQHPVDEPSPGRSERWWCTGLWLMWQHIRLHERHNQPWFGGLRCSTGRCLENRQPFLLPWTWLGHFQSEWLSSLSFDNRVTVREDKGTLAYNQSTLQLWSDRQSNGLFLKSSL